MNKNCLFIINGLGMGNSTRCYAIIEYLLDKGMKIHVLTSGNGITFFKDKASISSLSSMNSLFYGETKKGVSLFKTLLCLPLLIRLYLKKCVQVGRAIKKINPDIVVIDSEYTIFPLLKRNFPVISINNSDFIVSEYLKRKNKPSSILWHFWIIEFSDYIFNRLFPDAVISPSLYASGITHKKFRHVELIIRRELLKAAKENSAVITHAPLPKEIKSISCILSSSVFGRKIDLDLNALPYKINFSGRDGCNKNNLFYHGVTSSNIDLLSHSDILIINGGFSSSSEAMFLNKPTLIIPIESHAEQFINACVLKDYGIGLICKPGEVRSALRMFYDNNNWGSLRMNKHEPAFNGAEEAAKIILSFKK